VVLLVLEPWARGPGADSAYAGSGRRAGVARGRVRDRE